MTITRTGSIYNTEEQVFEQVVGNRKKSKAKKSASDDTSLEGQNSRVQKVIDNSKKKNSITDTEMATNTVDLTGDRDQEEAPKEEDCLNCKKHVGKKDKAMFCDICLGWTHLGCSDVKSTEYTFLDKNDVSGLKWICPKCIPRLRGRATS